MIELLAGVRVVESATLLNGSTLGMFLASLGADVVKIETPWRGDYLRDILGTIAPHQSPAHLQYNSGKRSLALDLRSEAGREAFWRLHATADVFVDGNIAGACDRLGVGYEAQRERRPSIVYCQYTGFGAVGPYGSIPTHGYSMNALGGDIPAEMGEDGLMHEIPKTGPMPIRSCEATNVGALWAAYMVAAALVQQRATGEGTYIDVSAADAVVITTGVPNVYIMNEHRLTDRSTLPAFDPSGAMTGAKYQIYETKDGKAVMFGAVEYKFWDAWCRVVGREDLLDASDRTLVIDFANDEALRREVQRVFHTRTADEWMALAAANDIAIAPVTRSIRDLPDDPHVGPRNVFHEGVHPDAGPFTYLGIPAVLPDHAFEVVRPAPGLGQHTREVLAELGYDDAAIDELTAAS